MKTHTQSWYRDAGNKKLSGVCAGFARRYELPVWLTRLVAIVVFLTFPVAVMVAYLLAHLLLPERYW